MDLGSISGGNPPKSSISALIWENHIEFGDFYLDLGRNQEGFGELEATSGDDVIALQMCLQRLGYFTNEIDGKFAGQTVKALKKYQASIGVQEVGFASIELQKQLYAQVNSADNFDPSLYTPAQLLEIVSIINNYLP